jgi:hypothetical protein
MPKELPDLLREAVEKVDSAANVVEINPTSAALNAVRQELATLKGDLERALAALGPPSANRRFQILSGGDDA